MAFSPKTLITLDVIAVLLCFFGFEQTRQKAGVPVTFGNVGAATVVEFSQTGGISAGDTLVAIGATPVVSKLHAEHCFDEYRVGQSVSLHLKNRSEIRRIDVKTTYFYSDMYLTIQVLVGSIFFSLGVLAVYRRRTERAAIVFHWFMVTIAIVTMITWGNYAAFDYGAGVVMRMLYPALYALLGALFLHFSLIFPLPKLRARSVVLTVLYIVTGLLAGLSAAAELLYIQGVAGFSLAEQTLSWCGWYAAATSLFAVTSFLLHFRYAREESERRKLLWILFGASISVTGYFGLRLIPELLYLGAVIPEEAGLLLAVVAPVTFAIAIIKYRALDIELIINRSTVYGTVFFILLMNWFKLTG